MTEEILKIILAAAAGSLVTAFGYTVKFSNEMTALKVQVANLANLISKPVTLPESVMEKLNNVCATTKELEKRIDRLEQINSRE